MQRLCPAVPHPAVAGGADALHALPLLRLPAIYLPVSALRRSPRAARRPVACLLRPLRNHVGRAATRPRDALLVRSLPQLRLRLGRVDVRAVPPLRKRLKTVTVTTCWSTLSQWCACAAICLHNITTL